MTEQQRRIAIPEPETTLDSLWSTCKALKEAVEVGQGIRGNREFALKTDLEAAVVNVTQVSGGGGGTSNIDDGVNLGDIAYWDASKWVPTSDFQWNQVSQRVEFAFEVGLHWEDSSSTLVEGAVFTELLVPGDEIQHIAASSTTEQTTTSTTLVNVTDAVLPGASFNVGDEYFLFVTGRVGSTDAVANNLRMSTTLDDTLLTGSDMSVQPPSNFNDSGMAYQYHYWFTYAAGDVQLKFARATGGGTAETSYNDLMAINLTQLGTPNYERDSSEVSVECDDNGWTDTSASITIGDGSSDWLVFFTATIDNGPSNQTMRIGLNDGSTHTMYVERDFRDTQDRHVLSGVTAFSGISSTTFTVAGEAQAAFAVTFDIVFASIFAIRLDAFQDHSLLVNTDPPDPGAAAEYTVMSDSFTAATTGDYAIWGSAQIQQGGNPSGYTFVQAEINNGGFNTVAGNEVGTYTDNPSLGTYPYYQMSITDVALSNTDDVDLELRLNPSTGNDTAVNGFLAAWSWATQNTFEDTFVFGDPLYDTLIDGDFIKIGSLNRIKQGLEELAYLSDILVPASTTNTAALRADNAGGWEESTNLLIGDDITDASAQTGAIVIPRGTEAQRPSSPVDGMMRYNTDINSLEFYVDGVWNTPSGGTLQTSYRFSTTTTAANPGNRNFRYNNGTLASVTAIYVNDTNNDNNDFGAILGLLDSSSEIYIQQQNNSANNALFGVTSTVDNTGWWTINVTFISGGTLPSNNQTCKWIVTL